MDLSDLESLLAPLSADEPCGPDLEYDAEFGEMERAAQSTPEQQFGDTIVAGEPADWKDVKKRAESLLKRTKDMRVVAIWARASLHQEGLTGFELALRLLRGYLETYWETVRPELDHEDDDDPTYRTNTLITFCDEDGMLRDLRETPLVSSRTVGRFSLRDVHRATTEAEAPKVEASTDDWSTPPAAGESGSSGPTLGVIEAAFSDVTIESIQAIADAAQQCSDHLTEIERFVTEKVGVNFAVSLSPARSVLSEISRYVISQLERRGVYASSGQDDSDADDASVDEADSAVEATVGGAAQGYRIGGKITSRKEAIKALDDVCDFYEQNEPSSPLPLLIRRAQRLASKSFLDILRDLAPDAVSQAEALGGSVAQSGAEEAAEGSSSW